MQMSIHYPHGHSCVLTSKDDSLDGSRVNTSDAWAVSNDELALFPELIRLPQLGQPWCRDRGLWEALYGVWETEDVF